MNKEGIKKNYIYNLTYQILNLILPLVTTPYISKVLGPGNIGIYSYTYSFVSTFVMVGSLGIATYGQREIASVNDDKEEYSHRFWEIQVVKMLSVSLSMLFYLVFALCYKDYRIYFLIQIPYFLAAIFDISWLFQGIEKFKYVALRNTCVKLLILALIFLLVKTKNDLPVYIMLLCISQFAGNITMWMHLRKYVYVSKVAVRDLKKHIKPTFIYFVPTISYQIHSVLDIAMLGVLYQDNAENGYYEQATKIINMAKSLTFVAMNQVLSSRISYLFAEKKFDEIKDRINTSIDYILFMGFGMGFGIYSIAGSFVPMFFGNGYDKVVQLLQLMSPLIIIIGISYSLSSQYFTPAGLQALSARFVIVGCFVNLVLNVIFIPKLESAGAVIASVLAETVITGLYIWHSKEFFRIINIIRLGWKKLIAGLAMLISMNAVCYLKITGLALVMLQFLVGSVVYIGVLVLLRDSIFNLIVTKVKENKRS